MDTPYFDCTVTAPRRYVRGRRIYVSVETCLCPSGTGSSLGVTRGSPPAQFARSSIGDGCPYDLWWVAGSEPRNACDVEKGVVPRPTPIAATMAATATLALITTPATTLPMGDENGARERLERP